jgi:cytoskeletal protein RodZ
MQSVGTILKKERTSRGLSLYEISEYTKISPWYLERLEKDEYDKLPQGPYIKGYLSTYAQILGVNENEIIDRYQIQKCDPIRDISQSITSTKNYNNTRFRFTPNTRFLLAGAIFFMVVILSWEFYPHEKDSKPILNSIAPATNDTQKAITASPTHIITRPIPKRFETPKISQTNVPVESLASEITHALNPETRQVTESHLLTNELEHSPSGTKAKIDNKIKILTAIACTDVENRSPVRPGKTFSLSTPKIYIFNRLKCIQPPSMIRHVYYFKNQKISEVELNIRAALWRTWSYKTISDNRMAGKWRVDIVSANGELLAQVPFRIQ